MEKGKGGRKRERSVYVHVYLPRALVEKMGKLIKKGLFVSVSDVIKHALREYFYFLEQKEQQKKEEAIVARVAKALEIIIEKKFLEMEQLTGVRIFKEEE